MEFKGGGVKRARACVGSASGPAAPQGSIKAQDLRTVQGLERREGKHEICYLD